jgi:hypothetical protein
MVAVVLLVKRRVQGMKLRMRMRLMMMMMRRQQGRSQV